MPTSGSHEVSSGKHEMGIRASPSRATQKRQSGSVIFAPINSTLLQGAKNRVETITS